MALRVRDRGETWIQWEVYDLSFPAKDYGQFRIDTNGTSYYWTSSNSDNNTWYTVSNLSPGTTYSATAYAYTNAWYSAGSASGTTLSPPPPPRPTNFSWTTSKTSGGNFNLTASEWNSFTSKINEFRTYKGLSSYSFSSAITGNNFTASHFNQARTAINAMTTNVPSSVSSGDPVTAFGLNLLRDSLNSIG